MEETYRIGDLARDFDVTPRTIRFYEAEGLLSPRRRGRNRIYRSRDRVRLKLILRGKRLGFSLGEIRALLDLYDAPEGRSGQLESFIEKIREHRTLLLEQRKDIDAVLSEMKSLERQCRVLLESRSAGATD